MAIQGYLHKKSIYGTKRTIRSQNKIQMHVDTTAWNSMIGALIWQWVTG